MRVSKFTYRITKPYNSSVKEGDLLEVDFLHPSLIPHVVLVSAPGDRLEKRENDSRLTRNDSSAKDEEKDEKPEKQLTKAQIDKMHAEALAIDAALYPAD